MGTTPLRLLCASSMLCLAISSELLAAPQDEGRWSPVVDFPVLAIHSILTPKGKVLNFGAGTDGRQNTHLFYDVWDPDLGTGANSHNTLVNTLGVDSFCSAAVLMPETGNVLMSGGSTRPTGGNGANNSAPVFNPLTNALSSAADMNSPRWYPTSTVLTNGDILLVGGRDTGGRTAIVPEVYSPATNKWRSLLGISTSEYSYAYPRQWVAPNGKIFGYDSRRKMYSIDTTGNGSLEPLGELALPGSLGTGAAVMYQPGKILQVGGGNATSTNAAAIIDINGAAPAIRNVAKPSQAGRLWVESVVLPNGKVMIVGGSATGNQLVSEALKPEIWDPATEAWSTMETGVKARLYHSTALLLKDGRIMVAGGGAPGPQVNTNAELFSPPYLFNSAGQLATRPTIVSAPDEAPYDSRIAVRHKSTDVITRATLIKTGATTHSNNMEQRFIELDYTDIHNGVSVSLPDSPSIAPPGYYLLHLLNNKGVPSEAHIIRISNTAELAIGPYPVAVADSARSNLSATITINVLANDTANGKGLVEVNQYSQKGGTARISNNKIIYKPKAGFNGTDAFWYVMEDDQGRTNSAKVTVTVTASDVVDVYPTATPDNVTANGSGTVTIDALANDIGNGLTLNAPNAWSLKGGNVALSNNKITYKPKAGYNGSDNIWYTFKDNQNRANSGVINITVTGNDGTSSVYPTATTDEVSTTTAAATTIDVLANDTGSGLVLNAPNAWSLNGGTVALQANQLIYRSKAGFTGSDNIWYTFKDALGRANSGQVNITVTAANNSAYPVANPDQYTTALNTAKALDILANDTPNQSIAIDTLYAYTAKGGTTTKQNGKVLYTPKNNFTGEDNFWYVMIDAQGRKNSAQVKINVTP